MCTLLPSSYTGAARNVPFTVVFWVQDERNVTESPIRQLTLTDQHSSPFLAAGLAHKPYTRTAYL